MSVEREVLSKALVVGAGTFASRVLGLVRDVVTAGLFGADRFMDMFVIAFTVPNLSRRLFGEGAVKSAFIPVFAEEEKRKGGDAATLFNVVLTALAVLLGAATLVGWVGCGLTLLFADLSEKWRLFCVLLAILLPYMPLICLAALQGSTLNAKRYFLVPALAPALMNLCWIAAAWIFGKRFGPKAVAVGVLVSGVLQYAVQVPLLWRCGVRLRPVWNLAHPGLRQVARLMVPAALGIGVIQVNTLLDRIIAEVCVSGEGANSALYYGHRLVQLPLGVLGLALATAVFPTYARRAAERDDPGMVRTVNMAVRTALFMALPCMAVTFALNVPIVKVLFEHGAFKSADAVASGAAAGATATTRTAAVLFYYVVGLWAFFGVHVLGRAFHAMQDMRTPLRIALAMTGLNLALNLTLVWPMREAGLALASSISAAGNTALLWVMLRKKLGSLGGAAVAVSAAKCLIAAGLCGAAAYYTTTRVAAYFAASPPMGSAFAAELLALAAGLVAAAVVFVLGSWLLRIREMRDFAGLLRRRSDRS